MSESFFERFRRQMELMQFETLPLFSKPLLSWNLHTDYVGRRFIYRPSTESTLDDARRMLQRWDLQDGAVMLAETQIGRTGSRGTLLGLAAGRQPLLHAAPACRQSRYASPELRHAAGDRGGD